MESKNEAIAFLKQHQPMPSETDMSDEEFDRWGEVIEFFSDNPDPECLPLFLFALNNMSSPSLGQSIADVLAAHDPEIVVGHLKAALESSNPGVVGWAAEYAMDYPCDELMNSLRNIVTDENALEKGVDLWIVLPSLKGMIESTDIDPNIVLSEIVGPLKRILADDSSPRGWVIAAASELDEIHREFDYAPANQILDELFHHNDAWAEIRADLAEAEIGR